MWVPYTWEGQEGWLWDAKCWIPFGFNPATDAPVVFFAPPGGRAAMPAIAQGDPGLPPTLRNFNVVGELEYTDPNPITWQWVQVSPGSATQRPVYDVNIRVRKGAPAASAAVNLRTAADLFGTAANKYIMVYSPNAGGTGVPGLTWQAQAIGDTYWPDSIDDTNGSAGAQRTLKALSVPPQPFPWRPAPKGHVLVSGTVNTRPLLLARIHQGSPGGPGPVIVARGLSVPGVAVQVHRFTDVPAPGSAPGYGVIAKDVGPTIIYMRVEETASTSDTFSTSEALYGVKVEPVP